MNTGRNDLLHRFSGLTRRRFEVRRLVIFIGVALLAAVPTQADTPAKRIALLIQNDRYPDIDPADAAADDAATLSKVLKQDGFEVDAKKNLTRGAMRATLEAFLERLTPGSVALFYFKGIGLKVSRQTYLVPVDGAIWSEEDVRQQGTSLDRVMADLSRRGAKVEIAIVDAARINPFERRFRMYAAGLSPPSPPQGALVIFSEALNNVAEPTTGRVSPFMTELARQLTITSNGEEAFTRTRDGVSQRSKGHALPWVSSTLVEPFYFAPGPVTAGTTPSASPSPPTAATPEAKPPAGTAQAPPKPVPPTPAPPSHVASASLSRPPPEAAKPAAPALRPGGTFSDCPHCPEMMVLASGKFRMGSGTTPFDRPVHEVTIAKPFAIGRTVVTRGEWAACVAAKGCTFRPDGRGGDDLPAVDVTWADARQYAGWLGKATGKRYRLPTEAEWEYAARAGTTTIFAWGDAVGADHANCTDCGKEGTPPAVEPVRHYSKNGFGLFDMAGNVAQWVEDCWTLTYREAAADGHVPPDPGCTMRVVRGGSFETSSAYIKPTARFRDLADARSPSRGFRVARDVE